MTQNITILAALLPVLGIIIGATLQFIFSKSSEVHKQHFLSKNQAYIDYLKCVADLANTAKFQNDEKRKELLALTADAKTRICIYGSKNVIKHMAEFEKFGAVLNSMESANKFTMICNAMRKENLGKKQEANINELLLVLFGPKKGSSD